MFSHSFSTLFKVMKDSPARPADASLLTILDPWQPAWRHTQNDPNPNQTIAQLPDGPVMTPPARPADTSLMFIVDRRQPAWRRALTTPDHKTLYLDQLTLQPLDEPYVRSKST